MFTQELKQLGTLHTETSPQVPQLPKRVQYCKPYMMSKKSYLSIEDTRNPLPRCIPNLEYKLVLETRSLFIHPYNGS